MTIYIVANLYLCLHSNMLTDSKNKDISYKDMPVSKQC